MRKVRNCEVWRGMKLLDEHLRIFEEQGFGVENYNWARYPNCGAFPPD